ncbi:PREDICTED: testis-expressed sequence 38 protein, partial [Gekko japonicus]|uniref:Testis-expressed sequence 38 protein n=1 Tax=Gekko japonicus TaxID=146911 RepID=A0ABM1LAL8_GEKJA
LFAGLLHIYFGGLGLCYILVFSCMLVLHWRKGIQRERRAKAWVERMKTECFFHRTLAYWADKEAHPVIKREVTIPESKSISKQGTSNFSNEATKDTMSDSFLSLPDADPYKPVFHEVSCASALAHLPPLLEHSASYPCSNISAISTPFNLPLKFAMLKNESHHVGSNISA